MLDILGKLLGSPARVKLLRLFLFNPKVSYTLAEAAARARVSPAETRRELSLYVNVGLVKARAGNRKRYTLDETFSYLSAFQHLLLNLPVRSKSIVERIRTTGTVRLVVLSGLFSQEYEGRVDLLIVGDKLSEMKLKKVIRSLEAEIGKELKYVTLGTEEFRYRLGIYDKLVRDILDYPHAVVFDRLHLPLR